MSVNLEKQNLNFLGLLTLGGFTSVGVNMVVHPLSTVKTRLMANLPKQQIFRLAGLYNGFFAVCVVDLASFPIAYGVHGSSEGRISSLWASIMAGLISAPIVSIGEGAMTNRQLNKPYSFTVLKRSIRLTELTMTILREVPFTIGVFHVMPVLQELIQKRFLILQKTSTTTIAIGAITGATIGFLTTPCDLIKTKVQTMNPQPSIREVVQSVVKNYGWKGFFHGSITRTLYIGSAGVVMNLFNEAIPHHLTKTPYFRGKSN